jgi:hypothetical protein
VHLPRPSQPHLLILPSRAGRATAVDPHSNGSAACPIKGVSTHQGFLGPASVDRTERIGNDLLTTFARRSR